MLTLSVLTLSVALAAGCARDADSGSNPKDRIGNAEDGPAAIPLPDQAASAGGESDTPTTTDPLAQPTPAQPTPAAKAWPSEPSWVGANSGNGLFGPITLRVSDNGGLVFASGEFGGSIHRTADGVLVSDIHQLTGHALDGGWNLTAQPMTHEETLHIREVQSGITVAELAVPPSPGAEADWLREMQATISVDGSRAAAFMCWDQPGEGPTFAVVAAWDLNTQALLLEQQLATPCGENYYGRRHTLRVTQDGEALVIALPGTQTLVHVDMSTGVATEQIVDIPLAPGINAEGAPFGDTPVLAMEIAPDGSEVAIADQSSNVRRFALPTLEPIGVIAAGYAAINEFSYVPTIESPLTWSPNSQLLAFVSPTGEPALFDRAADAVVATLTRPKLGEQGTFSGPNTDGHLMGLGFTPDGQTFVAVGEAGIAGWRCVDADQPVLLATANVSFSAPTSGVKGETILVVVSAEGVAPAAVFTLVVDGQPLPGRSSMGAPIELNTWQEGEHTLQVMVDDGVNSATSAMAPLSVTLP